MNFNLSSEQKLIRQTAADFASEELLKGAVERDIKKIWPADQISKMAELGFMGMMVSEKWGGSGLDTISYCIAMEESPSSLHSRFACRERPFSRATCSCALATCALARVTENS